MKKVIRFVVLIRFFFYIFCISTGLLFAEEEKPVVTVIPFEYSEGIEKSSSATLTHLFETELIKSNAFVVVKQSELDKILEAQEYSNMDFTDPKSAVQIGKLLAAKQIFTGNISKLGRRYIINIQLIDVERGKAVRAESADGTSIESFLGKINELAERFAGKGGKENVSAPRYNDKVRIYAVMGDRYASQMKYDKAVKQYEKALEIEEFNTDVLRRIITVMREDILYRSLYRFHAVLDGLDVAMRNYYEVRFVSKQMIDDALEKIDTLKAVEPSFESDVSLLLNEAYILKADARVKEAIRVLEKAYKLSPENPDVLAELGLLWVLVTYSSGSEGKGEGANGIELIKKAIKMQPGNPIYHLYLGRSLERLNPGPNAEALREYRWASELAVSKDFWTKRIRMFANQSMQRIYYKLGSLKGGILTPELDMPYSERLDYLEYLVKNNVKFYSKTSIQRPDYYLAVLYNATGKNNEAYRVILKMIDENKEQWKKRLPWLTLFKKILEESGSNDKLLSEVNEAIKKLHN